ncbi:MAG: PqqD family protein [Candidatus Krumholzibacteriota bacterium]
MMDMKTILTHNEECPVRTIGSGLVIVSSEGNETHSIEDIGAFIWNRIDGRKALDEILDDILNEYEVAAPTAAEDLQMFITQLMEAGLVLPVQ